MFLATKMFSRRYYSSYNSYIQTLISLQDILDMSINSILLLYLSILLISKLQNMFSADLSSLPRRNTQLIRIKIE